MMAAAKEWLTAVVTVTLLLSVAQLLIPEGILRETASFIGGLILLLALVQPLWQLELSDIRPDFSEYARTVERRQSELEAAQNTELAQRIGSETEAYISDKARSLGLALTVRVTVEPGDDGVPIPVEVELTGPRSGELAAWLETELGLSAERQVWNEEN